jgi:hypothetical protein
VTTKLQSYTPLTNPERKQNRQSRVCHSIKAHLPLHTKVLIFYGGKRAFNLPAATSSIIILLLFVCSSSFGQISLQQQRQEQINQTQQTNYNNIHQQNRQESYKELESVKTELKKEPIKKVSASHFRFVDTNSADYKANADNYNQAFEELSTMLSADTSISVKRAVYTVENAYLKDKLPYDKYLKLIQSKVALVKYILKTEKLDETNPDAIHYAIQKLYAETLYIKQANGTTKMIKPFHYDFNDPFGKDKQLVTKLLVTSSGQCHSLPLLYMILAEEFKIKSYLAYSPQHSFIKFQTKNGAWYNFETTNGRLTTDAFILGSGFIKSEALKSNIFNEPTNPKQVVANMFIDLANNYQEQFGYDSFQQKCVDKNLQYNTNYIYAKVVQSNYQTALTDLALAQENYPNPKTLARYPYIQDQMQKRNALYDELDNEGFTLMPQDAYNTWLKSLKQGQEKQNSDELKSKFITQLKK